MTSVDIARNAKQVQYFSHRYVSFILKRSLWKTLC